MSKQALLFGGTLEDKRLVDQKIKRLAEAFTKPIIAFRGAEGYVTEDLKFKVQLHRIKALMENEDLKDEATDYEAMVYLHTASLCQPLSRRWFDIYFHLFRKFYPEKAKEIGINQKGLTNLEIRELNDLKRWIFKQQRR